MTNPAENTSPESENPPAPAAGGEHLIPKYRLDEASAENRRLREENEIKNRLLMEMQSRNMPQAPVDSDPTPEELGLDPQTHKAMMIMSERIAEKKVRVHRQIFDQQIGQLANRTEKAELLATRGASTAKYIPEIERIQKDHFNRTGTFMPADVAYNLIQAEQKDARIAALESQLAARSSAQAQPQAPNEPAGGIPNAAATRQIPTGGPVAPASGSKNFSDMSLEEMEASLSERVKQGSTF